MRKSIWHTCVLLSIILYASVRGQEPTVIRQRVELPNAQCNWKNPTPDPNIKIVKYINHTPPLEFSIDIVCPEGKSGKINWTANGVNPAGPEHDGNPSSKVDSKTFSTTFATPGTKKVIAKCGECEMPWDIIIFRVDQDNDLWWFDGENPGGGYHIAVTLTAVGMTTGTFEWEVTDGEDKVDLTNGGANSDNIEVENDNTVTLLSTAPSDGAAVRTNDVTITFYYDYDEIREHETVVLAPDHLDHQGDADHAFENGYVSIITYEIVDQFDDVLPHNVPWNEDIDGNLTYSDAATVGNAAISDLANENWPWGDEGGGPTDPANATDNIGRSGPSHTVPAPQNPQDPLGDETVDHSPSGALYVGSATIGKGVKVISVTWQIYRDHARHE